MFQHEFSFQYRTQKNNSTNQYQQPWVWSVGNAQISRQYFLLLHFFLLFPAHFLPSSFLAVCKQMSMGPEVCCLLYGVTMTAKSWWAPWTVLEDECVLSVGNSDPALKRLAHLLHSNTRVHTHPLVRKFCEPFGIIRTTSGMAPSFIKDIM